MQLYWVAAFPPVFSWQRFLGIISYITEAREKPIEIDDNNKCNVNRAHSPKSIRNTIQIRFKGVNTEMVERDTEERPSVI